MFDIQNLPLSPEQARAARGYFGWSQAKTAAESGLRIDKLKRFEAGVGKSGAYIPDTQFLTDLRSFYEQHGYPFDDAVKPGASAKQGGLVFPAGVVEQGECQSDGAQPSTAPGRPVQATIHHMRIGITDDAEMGRLLDMIESNEEKANALLSKPLESNIWGAWSAAGDANAKRHAAAMRLLADNGVMFAKLLGRPIGGVPKAAVISGKQDPQTSADLLHRAQADVHLASAGDPAALARQMATKPAESVPAALGLN